MAEKTTVSLQDALKDIDKKEEYSSVGNVFSSVYKKQSESTMADEKLDRILGLELKFEKSFKLLEENSDNPNLESVIKDTIWKQLTELEKQSLLTELSDENTAKSAVFDYLNAVYNSRIQIEAEENKTIKFKEKIIKTFELKAYSDSLNNANFKKASYALYNYVLTYDSSELNYFEENFQNKISELISFYNLNAKQVRDLRKRVD